MSEADKVIDETTGALVDADPLNEEEQAIVDYLEGGKGRKLTRHNLEKLARALRVKVSDLAPAGFVVRFEAG